MLALRKWIKQICEKSVSLIKAVPTCKWIQLKCNASLQFKGLASNTAFIVRHELMNVGKLIHVTCGESGRSSAVVKLDLVRL